MIDFDDLPEANRTLILATLQRDILSAHCANIFDLARKNNQDIATLWRDICRRADQPNCTVAKSITSPHGGTPRPQTATVPVAGPIRSTTLQSGGGAPAQPGATASAGTAQVTATATTAGRKAPPTQPTGNQRAKTRQVTLAVSAVAILALGFGALMMVAGPSTAPSASSQSAALDGKVPVVRIIRRQSNDGDHKPDARPLPPPPQGTVHRLNAISKAFRNR